MLTTLGTGVVVLAAAVGLVWTVTRSGPSVRRAEAAAAPGAHASASAPTSASVARTATAPTGLDAAPGPASVTASTVAPGGGEGALQATVALTPGSCRYDADAEDFEASGTVRAVTGSGVVEVDVTWSDATGELDSASDIVEVAAGRTASWETSTTLSDPPQRGLTCSVTRG